MAQISTDCIFVDGLTTVRTHTTLTLGILLCWAVKYKMGEMIAFLSLCVFLSLWSYDFVPSKQSHLWNFLQVNKKKTHLKLICDCLIFKIIIFFLTWLHLSEGLEEHIWWNYYTFYWTVIPFYTFLLPPYEAMDSFMKCLWASLCTFIRARISTEISTGFPWLRTRQGNSVIYILSSVKIFYAPFH